MFNIKRPDNKLIIKVALWVGLGIAFMCFAIRIYSQGYGIPDTDYCNLILEANDIISGNVLLNDWSQTGISFLTTDLLYYMIAVAIKGINIDAHRIASSLMFAGMIFAAIPLLRLGKENKNQVMEGVAFFSLAALPSNFCVLSLRAHTGVYVWIFIAIACFYKMYKGDRKKCYAIGLCVSIIGGCIGDAIMYIVFLFPAFCFLLRDLLFIPVEKDKKVRIHIQPIIYPSVLIIGSAIVANVLNKVYYSLSTANKNSVLSGKIFEDFSAYPNKFYIYLKIILGLNHADFSKQSIFSVKTGFFFINVVLVILSFIIIGINIREFIQRKNNDVISQFLSLGFVMISLSMIITNIVIDTSGSRYIAVCPVIFAILLLRYAHTTGFIKIHFVRCIPCNIVMLILASILLVHNAQGYIDMPQGNLEQASLTTVLTENGLTSGYSNFWDSSIVTVLSKNKCQVRAILMGDTITPYHWGSKKSWYKTSANFVIVRNPEWAAMGVNYANAISRLGEPAQIIVHQNYKILIYNYDISKKLVQTNK